MSRQRRSRLLRLQTKATVQQMLEKQWQVDNQRPLTPQVQYRLGSQVAQLVDDNVPAEELAQGASTTSPPLTPTQDPPMMAPARSSLSSERYDAGPMLAGGATQLLHYVRPQLPPRDASLRLRLVRRLRVSMAGRRRQPVRHAATSR